MTEVLVWIDGVCHRLSENDLIVVNYTENEGCSFSPQEMIDFCFDHIQGE